MSDVWNVPLDEIPDDWVAPEGSIQSCQIDTLEKSIGKNSGKTMAVLGWSVAEGEYHGLQGTEYFVFGTDDDPLASDPAGAWRNSAGSRNFKKFVGALGFTGAFTQRMAQEAIGQKFDGLMGVEPATGQFSAKNRIRRFYPYGSAPNANGAQAAPVVHQAPARQVATPQRPVAQTPQRPQAPQRPVAQTPQRPAPQRPAPRQQAVVEEVAEEG